MKITWINGDARSIRPILMAFVWTSAETLINHTGTKMPNNAKNVDFGKDKSMGHAPTDA